MLAIDFTTVPVIGAVAVAALAALAAIWLIPKRQSRRWAAAGITGKELAELENGARATIVQIVGGVALILTFAATWMQIADARRATDRTLSLNREQGETQRFTAAVRQLGSPALEQRLGALYGLDRIAFEDKTTRRTVEQIVLAWVRRRDALPRATGVHAASTSLAELTCPKSVRLDPGSKSRARPDTQAALEVITDFAASLGEKVDLSDTDLHGVRLRGRDLRTLDLAFAELEGAHLEGTRLDRVHLDDTCLAGSFLRGASMIGASFINTDLRDADLTGAQLQASVLGGADFTDAALYFAKFNRAGLPGRLAGALMVGADLRFHDDNSRLRKMLRTASDTRCVLLPWHPVQTAACTQQIKGLKTVIAGAPTD